VADARRALGLQPLGHGTIAESRAHALELRRQCGWMGTPLMASLLLPAIATGAYLLILAYDWGGLDFKAARAMSHSTTRQIRILVLLLLAGMHGYILWTSCTAVLRPPAE